MLTTVYSNVLASMLDQWLQTQVQLAVTTHEFMALSEIGEDTIVYSEHSDYALILKKRKSFIIQMKSIQK